MDQLIPTQQNDGGNILVTGRDLHLFLEVKEKYTEWVKRMMDYGFSENEDYKVVVEKVQSEKRDRTYELINHHITIDMGKEISMLQRNEKGKQARQYFIEVEKKWNSPEMIVKRAMEIQDHKIKMLQTTVDELKPKALFAEAVETSKSSVLVGELSKIIKQNGVNIGPNRLFVWLRDNGFLIRQRGEAFNSPTQKSMEQKLFEIKKRTINNPYGSIRTTRTPKVTGKGQIYFVKKFLEGTGVNLID